MHVGVLFDGQLFDGLTADVGIAHDRDGDEADWAAPPVESTPRTSPAGPRVRGGPVGLGVELAG